MINLRSGKMADEQLAIINHYLVYFTYSGIKGFVIQENVCPIIGQDIQKLFAVSVLYRDDGYAFSLVYAPRQGPCGHGQQ